LQLFLKDLDGIWSMQYNVARLTQYVMKESITIEKYNTFIVETCDRPLRKFHSPFIV